MDWREIYKLVMASDVERDGMWLEAWEVATDDIVLTAFYSDVDGSISLETPREDVPPEFVE